MRNLIDNQDVNLHQAIERTYNAKCKPFNDRIDEIVEEIDNHFDQILKKEERRIDLVILLYPNLSDPLITNLEKEIKGHEEEIEALKEQISKLQDDLGEIYDWYQKMIKWANKKHVKAAEALENLYRDCLDNESDDD